MAWDLAPRLRDADREEMVAIHGTQTLAPLLRDSIATASTCFAIFTDGRPQFIFGVHPSPQLALGWIWACGSDVLFDEHRRWFIRSTPYWLEQLSQGFEVVGNLMDTRNTVHRRWLEWAGFEFGDEPIPLGPDNTPFVEFIKHV